MFSELLNRAGRAAVAALAALALLFWAGDAQAQQGAITGQVVDGSNLEPVVGAQVFLPGTDYGSLTNEEGRFRITGVPAGQHQVRVRLLGYRPASRTVTVRGGETTTVNFQLSVSAVALEEVVVTMTGQRQRRELGNAVSTVDAAQTVEQRNPTDLVNLLQASTPGVQITTSSGTLGSASNIRIRGNTSINLSNTPIVYVDGARINNSDSDRGVGGQDTDRLDDLSPDDIQSIEVVKGPAAATLYGTAASAGVILIRTKQGSESGDTEYRLQTELGGNYDLGGYNELAFLPTAFGFPTDTAYFMDLLDGEGPNPDVPGVFGDFYDPFNVGATQDYSGTIRGGSSGITYYLSGSYEKLDGTLPANKLEDYNGRVNFTIHPSEQLDLQVNTSYLSNFTLVPLNDNAANGYIGAASLGSPFNFPIRRADPDGGGEEMVTCPLAYESARGPADLASTTAACNFEGSFFAGNSFGEISAQNIQDNSERFVGSTSGTWRPLDFLTARATMGYDALNLRQPSTFPASPAILDDLGPSFRSVTTTTSRVLTLDGSVSAGFQLTEEIGSETTAGGQFIHEQTESRNGFGQNIPPGGPTLGNAAESFTVNETFTEVKTLGVFFQEQLDWKNRLYLTGAVRLDDNSALGENLDVQELFNAQLSYVLSEEDWFPELFQDFRLRGAWGESAKQPGPFNSATLLTTSSVPLGGTTGLGATPSRPGNPDLKPETGEEIELGFDATVLDGRFSMTATYFSKDSENVLVQRPLAPSQGFTGARWTNIGAIENEGLEFSFDATPTDRENFTWHLNGTLSNVESTITRLEQPINLGDQEHRQGEPFGAFFVIPFEVNEDGSVSPGEERVFAGQPTPEWTGSLSSTVTLFEHLSLHALGEFNASYTKANLTDTFACGFFVCPRRFATGPDGELTDDARLRGTAGSFLEPFPFLQDGDFVKLRSASLSFDVPEQWLQSLKVGVESAKLTLLGENLATFTGFEGVDPEVATGGRVNAVFGEFLTVPPTRRWAARVEIGF